MCGINLLYRQQGRVDQDDLARVRTMNAEMAYRGPDADGLWYDQKVVLGHRRLAIIGLTNGDQPLRNEDRSLALVCNGEIFNHRSLRLELEARGHRFATASDCEVIVHLYEEVGAECVDRLQGMFAFALWDAGRQALFMARDRSGEKPLYYASNGDRLLVSSEHQAIRRQLPGAAAIDMEVVRQTLLDAFPSDPSRTYCRPIRRLAPAHHLWVQGETQTLTRYWRPQRRPAGVGIDRAGHQRRVVQALREAVQMRLQSEVPIAILLSSGVDSGAIACLARECSDEVHVLTAGYRGQHACDERALAERLAKERGLIWHPVELSGDDFFNHFNAYTAFLDEPVPDTSAASQWALYREAAKLGFKVLLTGTGGDELFFGYPDWNRYAELLALAESAGRSGHSAAPGMGRLESRYRWLRGRMIRSIHRRLIGAVTSGWGQPVGAWPAPAHVVGTAGDDRGEHPVERIYRWLWDGWLPNDSLFLGDKLGMAHSLELRAPFVDHRLCEAVQEVPFDYLYQPTRPKGFLIDALRGVVPDYILERRKTGFTPPRDFVGEVARRGAHGGRYFTGLRFRIALLERFVSEPPRHDWPAR